MTWTPKNIPKTPNLRRYLDVRRYGIWLATGIRVLCGVYKNIFKILNLRDLDLRFRPFDASAKSEPNILTPKLMVRRMVMNPMGSQSVKNQQQKYIQVNWHDWLTEKSPHFWIIRRNPNLHSLSLRIQTPPDWVGLMVSNPISRS